MIVPIKCFACGQEGTLALEQLTAALRCECGSTDIDVVDNLSEKVADTAPVNTTCPYCKKTITDKSVHDHILDEHEHERVKSGSKVADRLTDDLESGKDPTCATCGHEGTLHGNDDGSCTVPGCTCQEFKYSDDTKTSVLHTKAAQDKVAEIANTVKVNNPHLPMARCVVIARRTVERYPGVVDLP